MNKLGKSLALSCIAGLLLISCSKGGPEETFELMRQEACEGDVEGFFSYIDTDAVARDYNRQVTDRLIQANENLNLILKLILYTTALLNIYDILELPDGTYATPSSAEFLDRLLWKYFKADIKKGEQSELCSIEIESSDGKNDNITFSFKDEDYIWKFKKAGKSWKLISVNYDEIHLSRNETYPKHENEAVNTGSGKEFTITEAEELANPGDPAPEQDGQPYDFRKVHWGMSKNQVKKNETAEFIGETDNALLYRESIAGLDSKLVYMFEDEKLRISAYKFENEYSDVEDYINDYAKLKDAYTKKYGEPYTDEVKWTNDSFKDVPSMLGQALIEGHVSYITQWSLPETNIILKLYKDKDEDEISLMAMYRGFKITNENTETLNIESGEIEEKL